MVLATGLLFALALFETPCSAAVVHPRDPVPQGFNALPYYPAPHGGWLPSWKESYDKAHALVSQMTLAEKTNITGGAGIYMGKRVTLNSVREE